MKWQTETRTPPKIPEFEQHVKLTPACRLSFRRCEYRDAVGLYIGTDDWHGTGKPPAIESPEASRAVLLAKLLPLAEQAVAALRAELASETEFGVPLDAQEATV
jgi:hypothetical protein